VVWRPNLSKRLLALRRICGAQKGELVEDNPLAARKNFLSILVMTESRLLLCVTLQPGGSRAVEL